MSYSYLYRVNVRGPEKDHKKRRVILFSVFIMLYVKIRKKYMHSMLQPENVNFTLTLEIRSKKLQL